MSEDVRNRGQKVAGVTGPKATTRPSFEVRRYYATVSRENAGGLLLREVAVVSLRTD